jgi:hypothetical protein
MLFVEDTNCEAPKAPNTFFSVKVKDAVSLQHDTTSKVVIYRLLDRKLGDLFKFL